MDDAQRRFTLNPRQGRYDSDGFYRLSDYELVTGWVGGFDPASPGVPGRTAEGGSAREGFEVSLLDALQRVPCVVAFSGGRDSSAVLAVATHVARREGLPDPVPASHDFTGCGIADETRYQELMIRHLGLREWHRFREVDAFDVLGDRARQGLLRHGLLWPALAHCFVPMAELAAGGGSLIVGEGGDEVLGNQRMTAVNHIVKTRQRPGRRMFMMLRESLAPASLRRRSRRKSMAAEFMHPWLAHDVAQDFLRRDADDFVNAPLRWDSAVLRHARRRAVTTSAANLRRIFADYDVTYHMPFLDDNFLVPFARQGGWRGWITRTFMMRMLFGDVVPDEICRRDGKARFGAVAVGRSSRAFLAEWQGAGVDPGIVDIEAFREAVTSDVPLFGTQMLLQAAWLASYRARSAELTDRL